MPNTGMTLPFVSYGLTSLVSLYMGMGIVLNVGLQPKKYSVPVAYKLFLLKIPLYAMQKFCISFFFESCATNPMFIVSYGLTSLVSLYMGMGIVLNVGLQPKKYS